MLSYLSKKGTKMRTCEACGRTDGETILDAKTLGLQQEFESGIYTCCQIAEWAAEQALAWFEATRESLERGLETQSEQLEPVLVPVRTRVPRVPWYR
jgi:hypothetical protein